MDSTKKSNGRNVPASSYLSRVCVDILKDQFSSHRSRIILIWLFLSVKKAHTVINLKIAFSFTHFSPQNYTYTTTRHFHRNEKIENSNENYVRSKKCRLEENRQMKV